MNNRKDPRPDVKGKFIEDFLSSALGFIQQGRSKILQRFRDGFEVTLKDDKSLVTTADTEAEQIMRELIIKKYPDHGIIGEEFPAKKPQAEFQWILDPIDGTQNFAHGIPTFGSLLALQMQGFPIIGIIDHPALGTCYSAGYKCGSFCNNEPITIQDIPEKTLHPLEIVCLACRINFSRTGETDLFDNFMRSHPSVRIYYDCFAHSRVVHGQAAAMVESNVRLWDIAPSQILCEEAGGCYIPFGNWTSEDGKSYYSAIFGKKSAVEFLVPLFRR